MTTKGSLLPHLHVCSKMTQHLGWHVAHPCSMCSLQQISQESCRDIPVEWHLAEQD